MWEDWEKGHLMGQRKQEGLSRKPTKWIMVIFNYVFVSEVTRVRKSRLECSYSA